MTPNTTGGSTSVIEMGVHGHRGSSELVGCACERSASVAVDDDERVRAWAAIHDVSRRCARLGCRIMHPPRRQLLWHVTAIDLRSRGRYAKREAITGIGATEIAALAALVQLVEARQVSGR